MTLLVLTTPIMVVAAIAIAAESGLPFVFTQERVGRNGRPFRIVKFRTMRVSDEPAEDRPLDERDPRITRVGRVLRATSIDELPQLLNVLDGDMSLIGPRPTVPEQVAAYDAHQRRRLEVRPGITGWAQVNGRNSLSWDERIEHDVYYVDHQCARLDCRILAKTIRVLVRPALVWAHTDERHEEVPQ